MKEARDDKTHIDAEKAEKRLIKLIEKKSNDVKKMTGFKTWWWRRRIRWQSWCMCSSTTKASSAEVANAKSVSACGYHKRLLDVVTTECSIAVLESAEFRRQRLGMRTVGLGPTSNERDKLKEAEVIKSVAESACSVQRMTTSKGHGTVDFEHELQEAQNAYRVNTADTHSSDILRHTSKKARKVPDDNSRVSEQQQALFSKKMEGVNMDLLTCESSME